MRDVTKGLCKTSREGFSSFTQTRGIDDDHRCVFLPHSNEQLLDFFTSGDNTLELLVLEPMYTVNKLIQRELFPYHHGFFRPRQTDSPTNQPMDDSHPESKRLEHKH